MSVDNKITSRNIGIDYLRFIGLSLIILAHASPPKLLFHFRCFDVCLMLFVSGLAYSGRLPEFSINICTYSYSMSFQEWMLMNIPFAWMYRGFAFAVKTKNYLRYRIGKNN